MNSIKTYLAFLALLANVSIPTVTWAELPFGPGAFPGAGGSGPQDEAAAAEFFENLFKDVDWEEVTKEMETIFKDLADQEAKNKEKEVAQKTDVADDTQEKELKKESKEALPAHTVTEATAPKDPHELFMDPTMTTKSVQDGLFSTKEVRLPTFASLQAAVTVFQELRVALLSLKGQITKKRQHLQEQLASTVTTIEQIDTHLGLLMGKKAYRQVLLGRGKSVSEQKKGTPDELRQTRRAFLDALKAVNGLVVTFAGQPADEELDTDADLLMQLAQGTEVTAKESWETSFVNKVQNITRSWLVPLVEKLDLFVKHKEVSALIEQKKKDLAQIEKAAETRQKRLASSSRSPWSSPSSRYSSDWSTPSSSRGRSFQDTGRSSLSPFRQSSFGASGQSRFGDGNPFGQNNPAESAAATPSKNTPGTNSPGMLFSDKDKTDQAANDIGTSAPGGSPTAPSDHPRSGAQDNGIKFLQDLKEFAGVLGRMISPSKGTRGSSMKTVADLYSDRSLLESTAKRAIALQQDLQHLIKRAPQLEKAPVYGDAQKTMQKVMPLLVDAILYHTLLPELTQAAQERQEAYVRSLLESCASMNLIDHKEFGKLVLERTEKLQAGITADTRARTILPEKITAAGQIANRLAWLAALPCCPSEVTSTVTQFGTQLAALHEQAQKQHAEQAEEPAQDESSTTT